MRIATESGDGGLTGGTGLPTRGRSAKARWRAAAEQVCVRWLLRIERLLGLSGWQLEQDYRRAAGWAGLPLPGAGAVTPGRERQQQAGAPGGDRRGRPKPR
jgi:hypothetical protein